MDNEPPARMYIYLKSMKWETRNILEWPYINPATENMKAQAEMLLGYGNSGAVKGGS